MILINTDFPKELLHTTNKIYSGIHWSERKRIKNDFYWWVKSLNIKVCIDNTKSQALGIYFTFKKNAFDCDNCSFMGKMIIDSLVTIGIFKDDSPKYISSITYSSRKGSRNNLIFQIL
jgi:hypothetical protein